MKRILFSTLAASALLAGGVLAAPPQIGAVLGTSITEINAALAAEGYEMTKYELDDGRIEVEAHDATQRIELYLDPTSGAVVAISAYARGGFGAQAGVETAAALQALRDQGWEILHYERERGEFEVYARRNGQVFELRLDPATGAVIRQERES